MMVTTPVDSMQSVPYLPFSPTSMHAYAKQFIYLQLPITSYNFPKTFSRTFYRLTAYDLLVIRHKFVTLY